MIRVLEIDRGKWGRGKYYSGGKCCAIGFYARKAKLTAQAAQAELENRSGWYFLPSKIIDANDLLNGAERERKLKSLFKKAGVELRFKGKTPK